MPKSASAPRTRTRKPTNDYLSKLQSPQWQKTRLKVLQRAEWRCQTCGEDLKPLTVHHGFYRYGVEPWDLPEDTLWCLCQDCHEEFQRDLLELKLEIGRLYPQDYSDVLQRISKMYEEQRGQLA